jgi:NhaA family Na+:H+ antiporter
MQHCSVFVTKPGSPAAFLERFVAVETRAAGLIVAAALLGVGFATFGNVYIENDFTHVLSEIAVGGFFLLVGLELRREFASGVLSGLTLWASVAAAAMGMALPAIIYASQAPAAARDGWVAVVATDIALAAAVMTLGGFSRKVRTLLLTVAVLDDLGGLIALATTGKSPELLWLALAIASVAIYAWVIRQFNLGVVTVIVATAVVVVLMLRAGLHPSLGAFAVGFCAPNFDPDNPSVSERVQERVHPWIAAIFLPIFVFLHTLVPIATPTDVPMSLVWTTVSAIVLGKVLGVGGVLILFSRRLHIAVTEAIAVGCAAAAALTVALIGVAATLDNTPYEQAVSLGILLATAIAFVLGVGAGRLTANKGESDAS